MNYANIRSNAVYVRIPFRVLGQTGLFSFFDGSYLEAPTAVLFHATAIHCHDGIQIADASFFVLE